MEVACGIGIFPLSISFVLQVCCVSRLYAIYIAAEDIVWESRKLVSSGSTRFTSPPMEIFKIHGIPALRDLYRRRWILKICDISALCDLCRRRWDLQILRHLGSTRSISPPWILLNLILEIDVAPALRDLHRRWWDLQNLWQLGSTWFISPPMKFLKFMTFRLYVIHIAADYVHDFRLATFCDYSQSTSAPLSTH
jgi:hypothetical protein